MKNLILVVALIVPFLLPACSKSGDRAVVVNVNGTRITAGNLKSQIADLSPDALQLIATDPKARQSVLDDVIAYELVLQEARRQGIDNVEFKKRQDAMRIEMERRLREEAKNELVTTLLRNQLGSKLNIPAPTDSEVREFYEKNRDKMVAADGRRVSLQEAAPMIKNRLSSMKQRDIYMEYANSLRAKAKISVNEKALESLANSLAPSSSSSPHPDSLPEGKGTTQK